MVYANTKELHKKLTGFDIYSLVGTAGSFDVLRGIAKSKGRGNSFEMNTDEFSKIYESIAYTSEKERGRMKWIPRERKKLIVFAFSIIDFALKVSEAQILRITSYSMKEGMIWKMLYENKK